MPAAGVTTLDDLIRGEVVWQNELLDDFILLKSDGFPTYHLAVVTDDHLMEITHVLRAEEWLPSTPRHLQIYRALALEPARFGHLPMILGPDRSKLSKRHGATAAHEYRDDGFLPEALLNFMTLLGWSLDDKTEIMEPEAVIENFSLGRVNKSAAIFDRERLVWMNGVYIRQLSIRDLADRILPFLERLVWMNGVYIRQLSIRDLADRILPFLERELDPGLLPVDQDYLLRIVPLIRERIKLLADSASLMSYFFQEELDYDPDGLVQKGMDRQSALLGLAAAREELAGTVNFQHQLLEQSLRAVASRLDLTPRRFFGMLRVAATGREATPPLFETMEVLGKERVILRIDAAINRLEAKKP
jgi:glutamyl-tRNA synthetase